MSVTNHQIKQTEIIDNIARQISLKSLGSSTVSPVNDFARDTRISLTSIHLPHKDFIDKIQKDIIEPLKKIEPDFYYYPNDGLHMTIKNIRVINDPPNFGENEVNKAINIFNEVIPQHKKFMVYFYKLLLFPNSLSLIGTTDEELDYIINDLNFKLKSAGIPDDKQYINDRYFFINMNLARFNYTPKKDFSNKVEEFSLSLNFEPYLVDTVTLTSCNAVFHIKTINGTWQLR